MKTTKKWLAYLTALALLACALPTAALAAETTIYLDGYYEQSESEGGGMYPGVKEVKEGGQMSLKGDLTRTGVVESKEFEDAAETFEIPVYTAKGPVTVTVTDGYDPSEPPKDIDDEDGGFLLPVTTAGIDTAAYDAGKKSAATVKENALFFDGKVTYVEAGSNKEKTVSLQEFNSDPDIWDKIAEAPYIHKGAKVTLTEPGTYCVYAYYQALAGGCVAYVVIPGAEKPAEPEKPAAPAFSDVAATSPFAAAIGWAVEQKVAAGYEDGTFRPGATCTVSHILTFLWRANGKPGAAEGKSDAESAAEWGLEQRMIGNTEALAEPCTRADAVTFLWQLAGSPEVESEKTFTDVDTRLAYVNAVAWAVENGVTAGTGDGTTFSPDATCTRGQIATFLYRALVKD